VGRKKAVFPRPLVWDGPPTQQERVRCLMCHSRPMHPAPLRVTLSLHYSAKWRQKRQQLHCDSMYHKSRTDQLSIMSILVILHICIRRHLRKPHSLGARTVNAAVKTILCYQGHREAEGKGVVCTRLPG